MNNKVKFLRGTSGEYAVAEKDNDTIYFTTDDGRLYIGNKEITGDGSITIDDALSDTSENALQNKVIKAGLDEKANSTDLTSHTNDMVSHITNTERTNWNDAKTHADSAHAPSDAQVNVIETIKVNGTALTPSSKAVDITVPSVGNGTITITQNGTTKGTFTTNQSGNTTIELTDNNTTYGVATSSALGLVKSGTDITVDSSGNVSVNDDSHNHIISNIDGLQDELNGKLDVSGGTMTGALVAQSNTDYTTAQVRNATMSTAAPSGGSNGQVHYQYS